MKIREGFARFQASIQPTMQPIYSELENGQSPETFFITCSDSRISPNLITQTDPGEIFVIRNAGNIVPKPGTGELSIEGTIEYAVQVLKVKNIVVCGHSQCGAVGGLLDLESLETLPAVRDWVSKSGAVLAKIKDCDAESRSEEAIKANVMLQLDHLMEYEYVRSAVERGDLELHGIVYHFGSGQVDYLTDGTF
ncbi:carbonic anhydrase [Mariniblastus fucicola]|uniref:Carbonic anhydrase n=1 Tax=Mariniblastus fucicola TaxID=980251 RepID=A0A5B9PAW8_9BACT|nr:carbonic anhydrase [Mariniblastus fucicola]QEG23478.1 Carbonic anhydrase 1 [Mariniblastus fucicola]